MMTKPAPVLHLDWLQMSIKWYNKSEAKYHEMFHVKRLDFSTRHFKKIEEIYILKRRIATVTSEPCSEILDKSLMIVKFDNWLLYDNRFRKTIEEFLQLNKLEFISFSRVDFCADFNEFDNGMKPCNFIKKYIYRKVLRRGKSPNIAYHFSQGKKEHISKGLKFGSNLSDVTAYIYNKTLEMSTVKWKPYIWLSWIKGGLDVKQDVWRVEFSMKAGAQLIVSKETGKVDLFLSLDLIEDVYMRACFFQLYERFFTFVWNDGQVRKDRMRVVKLFDFLSYRSILVNAMSTRDATRSTKIFIKKLHEYNNEMRGSDFHGSIYRDELKRELIEASHLQTWAMKKGLN